MKKITPLAIVKYITQISFFILLPGLFTLAFSSIKRIFKMFIDGNFEINNFLLISLIPLAIVVAIDIIAGRFFCGWLCAFGTLNDILYKISHNIFKINFKINSKIDKILKNLKYIILLLLIIFVWYLEVPELNGKSPWEAFSLFGQVFDMIFKNPISYILLFITCIGALLIERFFCRYLCPLGAVQVIISKISFIRIYKQKKDCGTCKLCTKKCSMGIDLSTHDYVPNGECIRCLKCIDVCPRKNPKLTISSFAYILLAFIMFLLIYSSNKVLVTNSQAQSNTTSNLVTDNTSTDEPSPTPLEELSESPTQEESSIPKQSINPTKNSTTQNNVKPSTATPKPVPTQKNKLYKDGVYSGTADGFKPGLTVSVTLKSDKITKIVITSHAESKGYYEEPFAVIPNKIINTQSTNVDVVSGATYTSKGIMNAVKNALNKAKI
ncbi:MAG: FMN-binding protein [Clostridiales bacterium]